MTTPSRPDKGHPSSGPAWPTEHLPEITARLVALARRWLHGRPADARDAEDVVQDTLLKAMQTDSFQGQTEAELESWLATIVRRRCANLRRREHRSRNAREKFGRSAPDAASDAASPQEARDLVEAALAALPDPDREVVAMRFLDGADWGAIGQRLGVTPGAARMRAARALLRLHDLLSGGAPGDAGPG
ncbi:MAG TPA: sigma-70 family RNA polymerase sigma factor [Gemmataceae bacterium]